MNIGIYMKEAMKTMIFRGYYVDLTHAILGIANETGELSGAIKKHIAYQKELDIVNVKEELGDLMWFIVLLCEVLHIPFEEVLDANIRKLRARYKDGWTQEEAINRDIDKESEALRNKSR